MAGHDYCEEYCNTCECVTGGAGIFNGDYLIFDCDVCANETEIYRPREE